MILAAGDKIKIKSDKQILKEAEMKEKPPVLSEGTIAGIFYSTTSKPRTMQMALFEGIAQAQRDADVEWYESKEKK